MRHYGTTNSALLLLAACLLAASGCGSGDDPWSQDRPPVHPATGQVLLEGKPIEGATVTFQPVDPNGKPGTAITDADGHFEAQTYEPGDGLTAGQHRVAVSKSALVDRAGNEIKEITDDGGGLTTKHFVPEKYGDFTTSGLEVQIEPDTDNELPPLNLSEK